MPIDDFLAGAILFALTTGSVAAGAWLVLRATLGHLRGSAAVVAYGLLATAGLVVVHLLPGLAGVLSRWSAAAVAVAALAGVAWWSRARTPAPAEGGRPAPVAGRVSWALAWAAAAAAGVYVVAYLIDRRGLGITAIDALTFEVPGMVHWIRDGSVWPVQQHWYGWAFGNYPMNGELVQLAALLPWRGDHFLRFTVVGHLALAGAGAYALARELRAPRPHALTAAAVLVAIPASIITALDYVKPDPIMLACFLGGVMFLVRHARTGATSDLVLAGLGVGLALGTKWYGLSYAVVIGAVWAGARLLRRDRLRDLARDFGLAAATVAAAGGLWLVRNLTESGNPVFPARVEVLGVTIFDAPVDWRREQIGFALADYLDQPGVWASDLLPEMRDQLGLGGLLCAIALLVAAVVWSARRRNARAGVVGVGGLLMLVVYLITPYTAQGLPGEPDVFPAARYALPALGLGAAVAASLTMRWGPAFPVVGLLAVLQAWAELDLPGVLTARRLLPAVVLLAGAAAIAWWAWRARPSRPVLAAAAAAGVVGVAAVAFVHQDRYQEGRYRGLDASVDWVIDNAPSGKRIAIGGHGPPSNLAPIAILPFSGPRFGNEVDVLGRVVREQFTELRGREPFEAALREGDYDLVVLMLRRPGDQPPEEAWARSLGYSPVVRGKTAMVMARAGA